MSSLLQFNGKINRRGVHLRFVRVYIPSEWSNDYPDCIFNTECYGRSSEYYREACPNCGSHHEAIYVAPRKPAGMFGCWVVFRYNAGEHVPDLSCPINVKRIPRDAKLMSVSEASEYWHS